MMNRGFESVDYVMDRLFRDYDFHTKSELPYSTHTDKD